MNLLPDCSLFLGTGRLSFKTALGVVAVVVIVEVAVVVVVAVEVVVEVVIINLVFKRKYVFLTCNNRRKP